MRIAHLSDLHLGYRQFTRTTPGGQNVREADVDRTLGVAVDRLIAIAPAAIVIGGDVFHAVRPGNSVIVTAYREFQRLREALPSTPVVMVAGNHDTPRSSETGNILHLFRALGVTVVTGRPERVRLPELRLSVLAVPDMPAPVKVDYSPDSEAEWNVLLMHGEVGAGGWDAADGPAWDYVALGHYHTHQEVAVGAWYSGSIDYTSTSIWGELRAGPKGIVEHDLATGEHLFHLLPESRRVIDLPAIDGSGLEAPELDDALAAAIERIPGGIDGAVLRQVVTEVPRTVSRALDPRRLREYRRRALSYQLDCRKPAFGGVAVFAGRQRRQTLEEMLADKLATIHLPDSVSRETLTGLASDYLRQAAEKLEGVRPTESGGTV